MTKVSTRAAATQHADRSLRRSVLSTGALGVAHLAWLVVSGPGNWLIWTIFVVLELWGFAQFALRAMLAWTSPSPERATAGPVDVPVDIVVTCTFHTPEELERTLISCREVRHAHRVVVTVQKERPELLDVIEAFDVDVVVAPGNHVDGFWAGARRSRLALWLEAGQVPMPSCIEVLAPNFRDPSVAYVQAGLGLLNTDSFAHLRGGRDEDAFRSRIVQPGLGERGAASWRGGGSIVRVLAIATSGGFDRGDQAALQRSMVRLQAGGWNCRYYGGPEVVHAAAPDSLGSYLMARRRSAIELLRVFTTAENPLRQPELDLRQRLDHVALASGFASSLRQFALTLLLIAVLLTGAVPYAGTGVLWAAMWVPLQLMLVSTNRRLARGTMERGDWTRQAWRTLAADMNAFATVLGIQRRVVAFHASAGSGFGALAKLRLPTATLLLLDAAVAARGLTLIWPRLLPRFSLSGRLVALGIGLVVIVVLVDVLQMAVRRKQRRSNFRLTTDLSAVIDGHPVRVIDLAVKGLGSKLQAATCPYEIDQTVAISLRLPVPNGDARTLQLEGVVRSLVDLGDTHRVGVQFRGLSPEARTGLISYCAVGHHAASDIDTTHDVDPTRFEVTATRRRATKLLSAAAMLLGVAVFFGGPAAPAALADVVATSSVCLQTSTGEPIAGATAGFEYDEEWHTIGETGEDGCVEGQMPETKTKVELVHREVRQVIRQHLGKNPVVQFTTVPVRIELNNAAGDAIAGGAAEFKSAGTWKTIGVTGEDGRLSIELLPTRRPFAVTLDGVRVEKTVDLRQVANVPFSTSPFVVSLTDSAGNPVGGAAVEYRGEDWIALGTTSEDGEFRGEMLPGRVRFGLSTGGGRTTVRQRLADDHVVRFTTTAVRIGFVDSTGSPLHDALIEIQNGREWSELGRTDADGAVTTELLPQTRSFRVNHEGRRSRIRQDVGVDPDVRFSTVLAAVQLSSADGSPLSGVQVEAHGGQWATLGTTGDDGRVEAELLPVRTRFRMSLDGIRAQVRQDLSVDTDVGLSAVEAVVRLLDSAGAPIAGSQVDVKTQRWTLMGTTDVNGEVRREVLPTAVSFRVLHEGLRKFIRSDVSASPVVEMRTAPVFADEIGTVSDYRAGSWRPFVDGLEVLPIRLQVRMEDGTRHTVQVAADAMTFMPSGETQSLAEPSAAADPTGAEEPVDPDAVPTTTAAPTDQEAADTSPDTIDPSSRGLSADAPTSTTTIDVTTSSSAPTTTTAAASEPPTTTTSAVPPTTTTAPEDSTTAPPSSVPTTDVDSTEVAPTTVQPDEPASTTTTALVDPVEEAPSSSTTTVLSEAAEPDTTTSAPATTVAPVAPDSSTTTTTQETSPPTTAAPADEAVVGEGATTTTAAPRTTAASSTTTANTATPEEPAASADTEADPDGDEDEDEDEDIIQQIAGVAVLAAEGEVFAPETMATTFTWSSPDAVATEVLAVTLEDAAVYTELETESTVGYEFLIDNVSDVDLERGSVVELHIAGAMELSPESQSEWECDADGATWRCTRLAPFLADSSSTIRVAAALPTPEVLTVTTGSRSEDFGILAAAAGLLLALLYGGLTLAGRESTSQ